MNNPIDPFFFRGKLKYAVTAGSPDISLEWSNLRENPNLIGMVYFFGIYNGFVN
jgi:hypothetical protein